MFWGYISIEHDTSFVDKKELYSLFYWMRQNNFCLSCKHNFITTHRTSMNVCAVFQIEIDIFAIFNLKLAIKNVRTELYKDVEAYTK